MFIKYRIIDKNVNEHSILVRYYTNKITEDFLANSFDEDNKIIRTKDGYPVRCRTDTNITIYKTDSTEKEIDELIQGHAPVQWLKLQTEDNKSLSELKVGKEKEFTYVAPAVEDNISDKALTDEEIDKLLSDLTTRN